MRILGVEAEQEPPEEVLIELVDSGNSAHGNPSFNTQSCNAARQAQSKRGVDSRAAALMQLHRGLE
jgi:hypothetical protein